MRVDKFLWCVRYYKTRSLATKACKRGHVKINGVSVKPAREVFPTDQIDIRKNQTDYKIEVLELPKSRRGAKWMKLYMMDITPQEEIQKRELLKYERSKGREKGMGRPTKKDRREMDDWFEDQEDEWFEDIDDKSKE